MIKHLFTVISIIVWVAQPITSFTHINTAHGQFAAKQLPHNHYKVVDQRWSVGESVWLSSSKEMIREEIETDSFNQHPIVLEEFDSTNNNAVATTELVTSSSISNSSDVVLQDKNQNEFFSGLFWRGVVVILCALWASNFPAAKVIMAQPGVDSSLYALMRFSVSALAITPFAIQSVKKQGGLDLDILKSALQCGAWVAFGYIGQTIGLLSTTASRSCVICSLHCIFVAVISELWRLGDAAKNGQKAEFDLKQLIPAVIAVSGVATIELWGAAGGPNIGDLLSFAQPIGFGMGYLILEDMMSKKPEAALPVSAIKLLTVACASLAYFELSPILHGGDIMFRIPDFTPILSSPTALAGIMYTGLVTTALALWVESIAFSFVPATDASIILTTEPLITAVIGAVALGETFIFTDYIGASLIVGACALSVLMEKPGHHK